MLGQFESNYVFLFIIPGFITVWSFRYFTHSKKSGDFEYLALSLFWGLVMVLINNAVVPKDQFDAVVANQFAAALSFSILGFILGGFGAWAVNEVKNFKSRFALKKLRK